MSKVKIQGNASGTGVLTVTAPNTSTDRTITLPDSTATIATTTDVAARLPSITDNGNATAITINSSEEVLINTTQEFNTLNGRGNLVVGSGLANEGITIYTGTSNTGGLAFADGTSGSQAYEGQISYEHSDNSMRFAVNGGAERMRILSTGGITFNGDSAAANALDDYEEGTWTPALTATTTAPSGMTYGFRSGDYTKIGDMVICRFGIKMNNIGSSGAGSVTIAGLPFTSISYGAYQEPNFSVNSGNNSTAMTHVRFFVQGGSTTCQGRRADTNADTTLVWSDLSNTSYFITCEIKYKTAS